MTNATVTSGAPRSGRLVITLAGEIDLENVVRVEQGINDLVSNRTESVLLDLAALEYIDSAGPRVLFALATRLELLQTPFALRIPDGSPVRKAVELSGLSGVVPVITGPPTGDDVASR